MQKVLRRFADNEKKVMEGRTEQEILDRLCERYETRGERSKRLAGFLEYLKRWHEKFRFEYDKEKLEEVLRETERSRKPAILFNDLKGILGIARKSPEVLDDVGGFTDLLYGYGKSIDIRFSKSRVIIRMLPSGHTTQKVYLVVFGKERWIVKFLKNRYLQLGENSDLLMSERGVQRIQKKLKNILFEDYCGIDLYQLQIMAPKYSAFIDRIMRGFDIDYDVPRNLVYDPETKELSVIDIE